MSQGTDTISRMATDPAPPIASLTDAERAELRARLERLMVATFRDGLANGDPLCEALEAEAAPPNGGGDEK